MMQQQAILTAGLHKCRNAGDEFYSRCNECKYMTGAGAQNNGGCSRENGVEQGQNAGISQQETLADDEPEDNEFS